jgi:molecular chaperone DnaK
MRVKIDYGIYFNNDFCQIARMEKGIPVIKRSETMKESLPLCVHFNKRGDILIGDTAFNVIKNDQNRGLKFFEKGKTYTFSQFTRTLGTNHLYESPNTGRAYSSEELLAECFKKLKSFILDENIYSILITVPSNFLNTQNEATIKAAELAGFKYIELLQEPVAAAIAYGLGSKSKDGFWLVFDFGGGTFDAAIIKSEEGILSVKDTDGDNWLAGKNLDEAIVDQIIIPNLQKNYAIDSVLDDTNKKEILRNAVKFYAKEAKIQLSFKDSHNILSYLGDLPFEDDNGDEPEIDVLVTQKDMENVVAPIFQKAIDISKELLKRNNLKGSDLGALILVGEPTFSPILRRMLKEQITDKVDTTVDPMTVVAKGAALFASTISIPDDIILPTREKTKLQLDIKYDATTVELEEMVNLKVLKELTTGTFPEKIYADVVRFDGSWSSGKKLIGEKATIVDVILIEGRSNSFEINVYDEAGNKLECQPHQFSILQGIGGLDKMQVLPYNIGIAKYFESEGKDLFMPVKGLEKSKIIPATGVINGFKTKFDLRPGFASDLIRFPIYQGDYNAVGTNLLLSHHICDILISGETLPALLPAGSDIDITIIVDTSQLLTISTYIPYLNHTENVEIEIKQTEPVTPRTIDDLKGELVLFYSDNPAMGKERFRFLLRELIRIEKNIISEDEKLKIVDTVQKEILKWK